MMTHVSVCDARRDVLGKGQYPSIVGTGLSLQQSSIHEFEASESLVDAALERVPVVCNSLGDQSASILGRYNARMYIFDLKEDVQGGDGRLERGSR